MNLAQFWPKPAWARACIAVAAAILIAIPSVAAVKTAIQNALNLDSQMNVFYARTLDEYLTQFRKQHPIILGLFSSEGGDFYLYMPGQADPIRADSVPIQYQVVKGVSHSSMALYAILQPYIDGLSTDSNWKADFTAYRQQQVKTLADADQMGLAPDVDAAVHKILTSNIAFIDDMLKAGSIDKTKVSAWAQSVAPLFKTTISAAADYQVGHWMQVMADWKKQLGSQWDQTYGATNSLYVTRRNNIIFTLMAQFFGTEAINERLMLFETTEFSTTPDTILALMSRIVKDRELGKAFFDDYFLMDVELLSTGARQAITKADGARIRPAASMGAYTVGPAHSRIQTFDLANGITPILPPLAPFETNQWPWTTTAIDGRGPSTLKEAMEK